MLFLVRVVNEMNGILAGYLILISLLILVNKYINWKIKLSIITISWIYYITLMHFFFKNGYYEIQANYDKLSSTYDYDPDNPVHFGHLQDFWNQQSDYVATFESFFHLPLLIIITASYFIWFYKVKRIGGKLIVGLTLLPVGGAFLIVTIAFSLLGYQP